MRASSKFKRTAATEYQPSTFKRFRNFSNSSFAGVRPKHIKNACSIFLLTDKFGSVVYNLLGGGAHKKVKLPPLASPVYHVTKNDPPILIFHGDKDTTVLIDQADAITNAYKKMNLSVDMNTLPGKKHGGNEFYTGENRKKVLQFLSKIFESGSY